MIQKEISNAVIKRLPRYYRYLDELQEEGVERISSAELSTRMKVTASQIRQDLNHFGGFGQQGYGYNVEYLYNEIGKILGLDHAQNMIIIGGGRLGQAIAHYVRFEKRGFRVIGIFDSNPSLTGQKVRECYIQPMEEMAAFLDENEVEIAALTIPKNNALEVAQTLVTHGIKAIWNFAHLDLHLYFPEDIVIENVHLSESLMKLSCNLNMQKHEVEMRENK